MLLTIEITLAKRKIIINLLTVVKTLILMVDGGNKLLITHISLFYIETFTLFLS